MSEQGNVVGPSEDAGTCGKKVVRIRRLIERKMVDSWQNVPHFFVTVAVDMTDIIRFRKDLGITINDFIMSAASAALKEHPWVNSLWVDGEAVEQDQVNLAMAVATENGLYYPVIKHVEKLSLKQLGQAAAALAEKAHLGQLADEDQEGGTFTISNMGMLGVESFSAIVTPPQAAVLAVGTVKGEVVADDVVINGRILGRVRGLKVRLTASARVEGDIIHKTIAIESGAHFEGSVQRADDPLSSGDKPKAAQPSHGGSNASK